MHNRNARAPILSFGRSQFRIIAFVFLTSSCASSTPATITPSTVPSAAPAEPSSTPVPCPPGAKAVPAQPWICQFPSPTEGRLSPSPTPWPTATQVFEWPSEIAFNDTIGILDYIDTHFGQPDRILYRNGTLGHGMDYGADFSNRVSFETRLVYEDRGIDFQINSDPEFRKTGTFTGVASLCLAYTHEQDPYEWYPSSVWGEPTAIPQKDILYRDLSQLTGLSPADLFERLRKRGSCTSIAVSLPHYVLKTSEATRLANFTQPPADCHLPCWNSLTPGLSEPAAIQDFFARLGVTEGDISTGQADTPGLNYSAAFFGSFPYDFPDLPPSISVLWTPGQILSVRLWNLKPAFVGPRQVIESLGNPQQVYVWIDARVELRYFTLVLRYPEHRTSIFASGTMVWNEDQKDELICFTDDAGVHTGALFSADPEDVYQDLSQWMDYPVTAEDMRDEYVWISFPRDPTTQPTEAQMDVEELSRLLLRNDSCVPPLFH